MKVLVVDVGGTHVKLLATGRRAPVKVDSGPDLTPRVMVRRVLEATAGWRYEVVTLGYPGRSCADGGSPTRAISDPAGSASTSRGRSAARCGS